MRFFIVTELPFGWEECHDEIIGTYYIDHNNGKLSK